MNDAPHSPRRRGFTLIEVMISVLFVAVRIDALMGAATKSLGVVKAAKQYETARNLMEQLKKQEPLQLDEVDGDETQSGTFDDNRDYRWRRVLTTVGEESDRLYLVKTSVIWDSQKREGRERREEVVEYIHLPTAIKKKWIDEKAAND